MNTEKINPEEVELIYIDLFAGAGGTSTGVVKARIEGNRCAVVAACVNHDTNAIRSHRSNHKQTLHFTEDITELYNTSRWIKLIAHIEMMRKLYPNAKVVLWASLECTNFSKAKGGMARDADSRTLAEHLFPYIEMLRPDYVEIENVIEFMSWGELDDRGKPVSMYAGTDYIRWTNKVCSMGYNMDWRYLNAADYGAYTSRKRLFIKFARTELPVVWPEPTHCKGGSGGMFEFNKWNAVGEVLDLEDEGKSIFGRKKELSPNSLARTYAGLIKYVAGGKDKWLLKYNSMSRKEVHVPPSIDDPCPVVSTQGRLGLFSCNFMQAYYSCGENVHSLANPCPTISTKDRFSYISPVFIDQQFGNSKPASIHQPLGALTQNPKYALIQNKFIMNQYSGGGQVSDINAPCPTLLNTPKQNVISCRHWIMNTNFNNVGSAVDEPSQTITANRKWQYLMNPQYKSAGGSIEKPCFTLIARMDKAPVYLIEANRSNDIAPFIRQEGNRLIYEIYSTDSDIMVKIKEFMAMYGITDIKMRMLKIQELKRIMGFPEEYVLIGTQAEQKKFIGNAVEVNQSRALCEATAIALRRARTIKYKQLMMAV